MKITRHSSLTLDEVKQGEVFQFLNIHKNIVFIKAVHEYGTYVLVNLEDGSLFNFKELNPERSEPVILLSAELIIHGEV